MERMKSMGHERLPFLPKSEKWRRIVSDIGHTAADYNYIEEVISRTAIAIDSDFRKMHLELGVQDAFSLILCLAIAARDDDPYKAMADFDLALEGNLATPLNLVRALSKHTRRTASSIEKMEIAKMAVAKALAQFYKKHTVQLGLFALKDEPFQVWRHLSEASGFCEISRNFFAFLTTDYFKYFLDREASAVLPDIESRVKFNEEMDGHIDRIVTHSFEVSKITQSFAAGWYRKNIQNNDYRLSRARTIGFLGIAINKIRDSLCREVRA